MANVSDSPAKFSVSFPAPVSTLIAALGDAATYTASAPAPVRTLIVFTGALDPTKLSVTTSSGEAPSLVAVSIVIVSTLKKPSDSIATPPLVPETKYAG